MNQLSENAPAGHSNPFASPSVAVAEADYHLNAEFLPLMRYSTVRTGLRLVYYSIGTLAVMSILLVLALMGFTLATGGSLGFTETALIVGVVGSVTMLVMVVGFCMTLACPRSDERSRAIASVLSFALAFGISLFGNYLIRLVGAPFWSLSVSLITNALYVASSVFFCLFLKRIGRNISSNRLEKSARSTLVYYGVFFLVAIVGLVLSLAVFSTILPNDRWAASEATGLVGLALLVASLVVLLKYLAMLRTGIVELTVKQHA